LYVTLIDADEIGFVWLML